MGLGHIVDFSREVQAAAPPGYFITVTEEGREWNKEASRQYVLRKKAEPKANLAQMRAQTLPGCCGVMLFYSFYGQKPENIKRLIEAGFTAAQKTGYGMGMYTMRNDSHAITDDGFAFLNGKTGNEVAFVTRVLKQQKKKNPGNSVNDE